MSKQTSLLLSAAVAFHSIVAPVASFAEEKHTNIPAAFTEKNANACLAQLAAAKSAPNDYVHREVNGVGCERKGTYCALDANIGEMDAIILAKDETSISLQFRDIKGHLVTARTAAQGAINHVSISIKPTPENIHGDVEALYKDKIDPETDPFMLDKLAPEDRTSIRKWIDFGHSACTQQVS